jgi:exonuclease VII small subunit
MCRSSHTINTEAVEAPQLPVSSPSPCESRTNDVLLFFVAHHISCFGYEMQIAHVELILDQTDFANAPVDRSASSLDGMTPGIFALGGLALKAVAEVVGIGAGGVTIYDKLANLTKDTSWVKEVLEALNAKMLEDQAQISELKIALGAQQSLVNSNNEAFARERANHDKMVARLESQVTTLETVVARLESQVTALDISSREAYANGNRDAKAAYDTAITERENAYHAAIAHLTQTSRDAIQQLTQTNRDNLNAYHAAIAHLTQTNRDNLNAYHAAIAHLTQTSRDNIEHVTQILTNANRDNVAHLARVTHDAILLLQGFDPDL